MSNEMIRIGRVALATVALGVGMVSLGCSSSSSAGKSIPVDDMKKEKMKMQENMKPSGK